MTSARDLLKFVKVAAPPPPPGGQGGGGAPSTPMNPVQLAVQQQQAAAMGDGTPVGNPEVMKAQESSIQAQQQAAQEIAQVQQQAQQEVMKAQQAAQKAQMEATGQAQGMVQKLQGQLEAAHTQIMEAKSEAELAKLEKQKAELFQPEPEKPEPQAPGVDHRPTLKRMSSRIGKALSRLEQVAPHLKLAAPQLPYTVQPDGKTIDINGVQPPHTVQQSQGYKNPGAGTLLQETGHFNQGILNVPMTNPSFGVMGDKVLDSVKGLLYQQPDHRQHFRTGFFESSNPYENMGPQPWQMPMQPQPQSPWWQQMMQQAASGFVQPPPAF